MVAWSRKHTFLKYSKVVAPWPLATATWARVNLAIMMSGLIIKLYMICELLLC